MGLCIPIRAVPMRQVTIANYLKNSLICSMSRKGECHDNAVGESFFGTLKTELIEHEDYRTRMDGRGQVFDFGY